jgi:hypothetical protein
VLIIENINQKKLECVRCTSSSAPGEYSPIQMDRADVPLLLLTLRSTQMTGYDAERRARRPKGCEIDEGERRARSFY